MPPGVYVALHRWLDTEFGPGQLFKVGHSADLGARLLDSAYATCFPAGWYFVAAFETLSKRDAFHLEQWALRACHHRRVDGRELVRASVDEITDIITRAARDLKISVVRRVAPSYPGPPARPNGRLAGDAAPALPALPVWADCGLFTLPPLTSVVCPASLDDSGVADCATDACSFVGGDSSNTVAAADDAVDALVGVAAVYDVVDDAVAAAVDDDDVVDDAVDVVAADVNDVYAPVAAAAACALPHCTSGVLRLNAEPVVLRDYQDIIVDGVLALLPGAPAGHIRVRMACGTGKSIVIAAILRRIALGASGGVGLPRQLVVVPSVYLLSQLSKTIEEWGTPCARLGGGFKFDTDAPVVVCVNNSLHLLADTCEFQHVFVDEAHHLDYNKDGLVFYEMLNSIRASGARVLLSATLMRGFDGDASSGGDDALSDDDDYGGSGSSSCDDEDEASSSSCGASSSCGDEASSCGAETSLACRDFAFNYSIEDGLADEHLCDYNIVIPLFVTAAGRLDRMPGLIKMVVEHPEMTRVLAYCNSIESAKRFCVLAVAAGVNSRCFFGDSPVALRDECIEALKDEIRMIVTVNTITEGADIPWADTAILVEPRRSKISIVQVLGRILRQYGGVHGGVYEKKIAYMVLPASDEESTLAYFLRVIALEDSRFRKLSADSSAAAPAGSATSAAAPGGCAILLVVDADGSPADFDAAVESVRFFSRYGEPLLGGDFNTQLVLLGAFVAEYGRLPTRGESYRDLKIGYWANDQRKYKNKGTLAPERVAALEAVPGWVWAVRIVATPTPWPDQLALLGVFVAEHGRLPARGSSGRDAKIGSWVHNQRSRRGILPPERVAALEAVPGWAWEAADTWPDRLALLGAFVTEHGRVPRAGGESYRGVRIGTWVSTQRTNRSKLPPERIAALEAVPGWVCESADTWPDRLALLSAFVTEHGRLPAQRETYHGVKIGTWITNQRTNRSKLAPERVAALEAVPGWVWEAATPVTPWPDWLALLVAFVEEHDRLPTQSESYRGVKIGIWVNGQRGNRDKLAPERVAALEAVPGWVWAERTAAPVTLWPDWLALLSAFVTEHGRLPTQKETYHGVKIGSWVGNQRTNRSKLAPERVAALEAAVPGWMWEAADTWPDQLALLVAFVAEHGRLPRAGGESYRGVKIGSWISTQRTNRGKLPPERVAALEAVPGWVWGERTAAPVTPWPDWLALLGAFVTEHGRLPRQSESYQGVKIGSWINTQRTNRGKMTPERVAALEAVPGWVWTERTAAPVTPWPDWLALLGAFVMEHGRLPRAKESYRDAKIGNWIGTQRTNRGKMTPERVAALEAVPGWMWAAM